MQGSLSGYPEVREGWCEGWRTGWKLCQLRPSQTVCNSGQFSQFHLGSLHCNLEAGIAVSSTEESFLWGCPREGARTGTVLEDAPLSNGSYLLTDADRTLLSCEHSSALTLYFSRNCTEDYNLPRTWLLIAHCSSWPCLWVFRYWMLVWCGYSPPYSLVASGTRLSCSHFHAPNALVPS